MTCRFAYFPDPEPSALYEEPLAYGDDGEAPLPVR